ncbi:DUF3995 domain-containing protein [Actinotalea solisilvae]|uniref:DUF3995 domain-containing protein n=1 Tax=Actinotalea solisilvae TaxID=2072922 RepID=UPI0018F25F52|nr:DUF3995 domain-containing protein [Actinotalea solisilvae]
MITGSSATRVLPRVGSAVLAAAAALHAVWAAGSAWPARDRRELANLVAGTDEFPGPVPCIAVAGALTLAAALVTSEAGGARGRAARAALTVGFAVRGVAGAAGATRVLVPWTPSDRFVAMDRRFYGPLCLVIAALVAAGLPGRGSDRPAS